MAGGRRAPSNARIRMVGHPTPAPEAALRGFSGSNKKRYAQLRRPPPILSCSVLLPSHASTELEHGYKHSLAIPRMWLLFLPCLSCTTSSKLHGWNGEAQKDGRTPPDQRGQFRSD